MGRSFAEKTINKHPGVVVIRMHLFYLLVVDISLD